MIYCEGRSHLANRLAVVSESQGYRQRLWPKQLEACYCFLLLWERLQERKAAGDGGLGGTGVDQEYSSNILNLIYLLGI